MAQSVEQLEAELGRAYRALFGLYGAVTNGEAPGAAMLSYHAPTIGAAIRYVDEGKLDGSQYFIGKKVDVLHEVLGRAVRRKTAA